MATIRDAQGAHDYVAFGRLCREYVEWCRNRYQTIPWLIDEIFDYQSLEDELKALSTKYGPPYGRTLLSVANGGDIVGGGAYRRLSDGVCELKRLYISGEARGRGIGRQLSEALTAAARTDGFSLMKLDTGNLMTEAIAMYASMGFKTCAPYHAYPNSIMPFLVFMEKAL